MAARSVRRSIGAGLALLLGGAACAPAPPGPASVPGPASPAPDNEQCEPFALRRCEPEAERLLGQARRHEEAGSFDLAIATYQEVARRYPTATWSAASVAGSYNRSAAVGIAQNTCWRARGPDLTMSTPEAVIVSIRVALEALDQEALSRLASCRFAAGLIDNDFGSPVEPAQVAPVLLRVSAGFDWSSLTAEYGGFTIKARDGQAHLFQVHGAADQWRWSAYATTDKSILDEITTPKPSN
jgi:hypothetical protein